MNGPSRMPSGDSPVLLFGGGLADLARAVESLATLPIGAYEIVGIGRVSMRRLTKYGSEMTPGFSGIQRLEGEAIDQ